ncbi:hypothetical protein [Viscerimonas tarda]
MKKFSTTVTNKIPPFGRNDSPIGGLRDGEVAASPPLPHPLSQKEAVIPTKGRNLLFISATLPKGIRRKIFHAFALTASSAFWAGEPCPYDCVC